MSRAIAAAYRRTGADLPGQDPRPTHHAEMEGWYWRLTDAARGRVVVALCGINRHPAGNWATVAVAAHPWPPGHGGPLVRSAAVDGARATDAAYVVAAGDVLLADERTLRVDLDDAHLDVEFHDLVGWPLRLGGGGAFSVLPALGQYWHPHALGGRASGTLRVGGEIWTLDGAAVYAEKNWGAGFPEHWWWGQAQGFADPSVCVTFGGGLLRAGPFATDVTGVVVRTPTGVVRFTPPVARVHAVVRDNEWHVDARKRGWRVLLAGDGAGQIPAVLPVPVPAERRNVARDVQHLGGRLRVRLYHRGTVVLDDASRLAALEVGSLDPVKAEDLAQRCGAAAFRAHRS